MGEKFPVDVAVQAPNGAFTLSEKLASGPVVVAFHRIWCPFCQQAARELSEMKQQLDVYSAQVVIVYREEIDVVSSSCAERGITCDCVSDAKRELEDATGLRRFSVGRYAAFSPRKLAGALRSGSRVGKVKSGLLQGRGTFVVGTDGRIVYVHQARTAADIVPAADVLSAVRLLAG
ncbi:redoxin domain-containing protein [Mycobacterium adipatum]|uniref:redoxin domain-containing protein n=1 Tax=Mycobacteriaceae TaxID=1762 RepID=UPI0034E0D92B